MIERIHNADPELESAKRKMIQAEQPVTYQFSGTLQQVRLNEEMYDIQRRFQSMAIPNEFGCDFRTSKR